MAKTFRQFLKDDGGAAGAIGAPANNAGGGQVAGIGVGPQGEPGVDLRKRKNPLLFKSVEKRKQPVTEESEMFVGHTVFTVDPDRFYRARMGKRKYARWAKYIDDDEIGKAIKDFGYKYPHKPIILKHENNGAMVFLRYGKR